MAQMAAFFLLSLLYRDAHSVSVFLLRLMCERIGLASLWLALHVSHATTRKSTMVNQQLAESDFERAQAKKRPAKPRIYKSDLRSFESNELFEGCAIFGAELAGVHAENSDYADAEITKAIMTGCAFHECSFESAMFEDTIFSGCDFSNASFPNAFFRRCEFSNCKLMGASLVESVFEDVVARNLSFALASFGGAKWKNACAESCDFSGADLSGMELSRVSLLDSRLSGASFFNTRLTGIDLTTCQIDGIVLSDSLKEVHGCKMSIYQLDAIAHMLGVLLDG